MANIMLALSATVFCGSIYFAKKQERDVKDIIITFFVGVIFTIGLGFAGMLRRTKIIGFLTLNSYWDPTLLFVLGAAVLGNMGLFHYIINIKREPLYAQKLEIPANKTIDARLVAGAIIFGLGWGLSGLCPGPAMGLMPVFTL